jgi:hypothetical protein
MISRKKGEIETRQTARRMATDAAAFRFKSLCGSGGMNSSTGKTKKTNVSD